MSHSTDAGEHVSDSLHPLVYRAIVGLALWLLVSAWWFFDSAGYIKLALAMISILVVMAVGIPHALSRAGTRDLDERDASEGRRESFVSWIRGNLDTATGRCRSSTALTEILLPIAAVAFGMMAFGIVFTIARAGFH
jgi:hypothetical protein